MVESKPILDLGPAAHFTTFCEADSTCRFNKDCVSRAELK
jgi:hypothetical protein